MSPRYSEMMWRALVLVLFACGSNTQVGRQEAAPVTRVVTTPADTPYAIYEMELWPRHQRELPATGTLRCAVSPEGALSLSRSQSSILVEGATDEGWSMLRLIHETGARTLYRFSHTVPDTETIECGDHDCFELQVGEQMSYPARGVQSYSLGPPGVVDTRVGSRFVFIGMQPGRTTLLLIMHNGDQKVLRFRVTDPSAPPVRIRSQPPPEFRPDCESHASCPQGECVEGLCAQWREIDCSVP